MSIFSLAVSLILAACASTLRSADRAPSDSSSKTSLDEFQKVTEPDFLAQISCSFRCRLNRADSNVDQAVGLSAVYSPKERKLRRGNAKLLGSLAVDLQTWANRSCLQEAVRVCGNLDGVASASATSLSSGNWHMPLPLGCSGRNEGVVYSPYDPNHSLTRVGAEKSPSSPAANGEAELFHPSSHGAQLSLTNRIPGDCFVPIEADICVGDCTDPNSPSTLYFSSPNATRMKQTVCGDPLIAEWKAAKLPRSRPLARLACEEFFWQSLSACGAPSSCCSAVRGTVKCNEAILLMFTK